MWFIRRVPGWFLANSWNVLSRISAISWQDLANISLPLAKTNFVGPKNSKEAERKPKDDKKHQQGAQRRPKGANMEAKRSQQEPKGRPKGTQGEAKQA